MRNRDEASRRQKVGEPSRRPSFWVKMRNFPAGAWPVRAQTPAGVVRGRLNAHRRFRRGGPYAHGLRWTNKGKVIFTWRCLCAVQARATIWLLVLNH